MTLFKDIKESLLHLLFPHICAGCGSDVLVTEASLCGKCIASLPETSFEKHANNPVEKLFWGRMPLQAATAQYYFTKEGLLQNLMHQFKYKANKDLGFQLGKLMGRQLKQDSRFSNIDALVPLPLFPGKEKRRGYNQAAILCNGMAEVLNLPVYDKIITRPQHTETQTRKGRVERWQNMEGKFLLIDETKIIGKHLLLVDDVVTTGSTLEACGNELLQAKDLQLSLACFCVASK